MALSRISLDSGLDILSGVSIIGSWSDIRTVLELRESIAYRFDSGITATTKKHRASALNLLILSACMPSTP